MASSVSQRKKEIEYESKIPENLEQAKFLMFWVPTVSMSAPGQIDFCLHQEPTDLDEMGKLL